MKSSYNIIKNNLIISQGIKEIVTNIELKREESTSCAADNSSEEMKTCEEMAMAILETARKQNEDILIKACAEAENIKKDAYEEGYKEGNRQGFTEAYDQGIARVKQEAQEIEKYANNILFKAKKEYANYLEEKRTEILKLSMNIAETILKKQVNAPQGLNEIINDALSKSRNSKTFIIKTNPLYSDELRTKIDSWKENFGMNCEIFIVADEGKAVGHATIEKNDGKIEIGITAGMEEIKKVLLS